MFVRAFERFARPVGFISRIFEYTHHHIRYLDIYKDSKLRSRKRSRKSAFQTWFPRFIILIPIFEGISFLFINRVDSFKKKIFPPL